MDILSKWCNENSQWRKIHKKWNPGYGMLGYSAINLSMKIQNTNIFSK